MGENLHQAIFFRIGLNNLHFGEGSHDMYDVIIKKMQLVSPQPAVNPKITYTIDLIP